MRMEKSEIVDDVLKMIENEITEKDLEYLYIFLSDMYENMSEEEVLLIAYALEKIDKDFYNED